MGQHVVIVIEETDQGVTYSKDRLEKLSMEINQIELVGQYLLSDFELYVEETKANENLLNALTNVWRSLCKQHNQYLQIIRQLTSKVSEEWTKIAQMRQVQAHSDPLLIKENAGKWSNTFPIMFRMYQQMLLFESMLTPSPSSSTSSSEERNDNEEESCSSISYDADCGGVKEEIAQILLKMLEQSLFVHVRRSCVDIYCVISNVEECLRESIKVRLEESQHQTKETSHHQEVIKHSLVLDPIEKHYCCTLM